MSIAILLLVPATGCARQKNRRFSASFTSSFDTVIQVIAYADSEKQFEQWLQLAETRFAELHKLFDIYKSYDGLNNLRTVNENAGLQPVKVDPVIISLLQFSVACNEWSPGTVNIALGPVLSIWHDVRSRAMNDEPFTLPAQDELEAAAALSDLSKLVIDEAAGTVFLSEKGMKLDVGAVAKGFAAEMIARELIEAGMTSGIVSAGGSNVRLIGKPADPSRKTWQIGLQNPFGNPLIPDDPTLDTLLVNDQSIVTSGDYQRYFVFEDIVYHHLIDPKTLQPAQHYRAVTVMTADSGFADFISSVLFLLPYTESRSLADRISGCEALWVFPDGRIEYTDGMAPFLKSNQ